MCSCTWRCIWISVHHGKCIQSLPLGQTAPLPLDATNPSFNANDSNLDSNAILIAAHCLINVKCCVKNTLPTYNSCFWPSQVQLLELIPTWDSIMGAWLGRRGIAPWAGVRELWLNGWGCLFVWVKIAGLGLVVEFSMTIYSVILVRILAGLEWCLLISFSRSLAAI